MLGAFKVRGGSEKRLTVDRVFAFELILVAAAVVLVQAGLQVRHFINICISISN